MAVKVKATEQFCSAFSGFMAHEKSKRGLGATFHEAVIMLLNENPDATPEELVNLFRETMTEVENTLMAEFKAEFGEDAVVDQELGDWKQCKSDYKRALELVDRRDLMKCNGWHQVRTKKAEVLKAMKEKDGADGGDSGGKAAKLKDVPEAYRDSLGEALFALGKIPERDAVAIVENFKRKAFEKLQNLGHAKPKMRAAAGNSGGEKVAANH